MEDWEPPYEVCFGDELMTGFLTGTSQPAYMLTAATLEDLGYTVDYNSGFIDTNYQVCCASGRRRQLREQHPHGVSPIGHLFRPDLSEEGRGKAVAYGKKLLEKRKLPPGKPREVDGVTYVVDQLITIYYQENDFIYDVEVRA